MKLFGMIIFIIVVMSSFGLQLYNMALYARLVCPLYVKVSHMALY